MQGTNIFKNFEKIINVFLVNVILSLCVIGSQGEVIRIGLKAGTVDHVVSSWVTGRSKRSVEARSNMVGRSGEGYYMEVFIGTPPQKLNILVDTGSSNFAVAASEDPDITRYFNRSRSTTYELGGSTVFVPYTQGDWEGMLGTDLVTIPSVVNVTVRPNIAFITKSSNFFINTSDWQGIVGFAFQTIARPDSSLEPYFDTLVNQGHVKNLFSMQLCGAPLPFNVSNNMMHGTMLMGDTSTEMYTGKLLYTPIYKEWYYEVIMTDVQVDGTSLGQHCKEYNFDKTIVDSGTTNLRFPEKVFEAVVERINYSLSLQERSPSDSFWTGGEILCWSNISIPFEGFPVITISLQQDAISFFNLHLSPQHYLRAVVDPDSGFTFMDNCFKFGIATSSSGSVLGAVLMEAFYVVFDRIDKRIGFAKTTCEPKYAMGATSFVEGPFKSKSPKMLSKCAYKKPVKDNSPMLIVAYVMAGICFLCVLPLIIMVVQYQVRKCRAVDLQDTPPTDTETLVKDKP